MCTDEKRDEESVEHVVKEREKVKFLSLNFPHTM